MRDNRIKTLVLGDNGDFSGATVFSATTTTNVYSKSINGEILQVDWNFNRAGSMALVVSGTGQEFWRRNDSSGASWQSTQPRFFSESTTGSIAGAEHVPFVVNGPVYLSIGSALSGTQALSLTVKYR